MGIEDFVTDDKVGIELLNPVVTSAQQLSFYGKEDGKSFSRPTTIQLLVNPAYRIYYAGEQYTQKLYQFLQQQHSVYPTYLGAAYGLTKPKLIGKWQGKTQVNFDNWLQSRGVVPVAVIEELQIEK